MIAKENIDYALKLTDVLIDHTMRDTDYIYLRGVYGQSIANEDYGSASDVMEDIKSRIRIVAERYAAIMNATERLKSLEPITMMVIETLCGRMDNEFGENTI